MEFQLNTAFAKLAEDILPSEEYLKEGTLIAEEVVNVLKRCKEYSIGRHYHTGSNGKNTNIKDSDFDIVVFVNCQGPPFDEVLYVFKKTLEKFSSTQSKINLKNIKTTKFSIQFEVDAFKFDLLPAQNFVSNTQGISPKGLTNDQQEKTLDIIKQNPDKNCYMYSGGLAEATTQFYTKQEGFVNEMVRLAKYWFKTLGELPGNISGAKSMIELVMIHSVRVEGNRSYLKCFERFLILLANFDGLKILFEDEITTRHPIPLDIKGQVPLVLDPANPYNNFGKNWEGNESSKKLLKTFSIKTDNALNTLKVSPLRMVQANDIEQLFKNSYTDAIKSLKK